MLRVSHGPFRLLERAFVERVKTLQAGDRLARLAVVAPSRRLADRLQRLVSLEAGLALLNVQFHTFHSLALGVLEEGGPQGVRFIGDPVFHDRLLDSLLDSRPELAGRFGGETRPRALASALRASLKDLMDAAVEPGEVREHFGGALEGLPGLKGLLELQEAYQAWQKRHGVFGSSGLPASAARAAEKSEFLAGFKEIIYYGFYDLTGLQLEFFERVSSSHPTALFFPYAPGHPAYRFAKDFFDLKLHRGGSPEDLGGEEALPKERLAVFSASGVRDEAWKASKEILRLRREGLAFDDIGVAARTLEPYRDAVRGAFEADAVPFDMPEAGPLMRWPLARLCMDLLTLRKRDFPAHAVSDIIESPYLKADPLGLRLKARWGRVAAGLGLAAGWLGWRGRLESVEEARPALRFLAGLREDLAPAGARTWKEWSDYALGLLSSRLELPRDASVFEKGLWERLRELTESLAGFEPLGRASWDFFLETWLEKAQAAQLEVPQRRGVRVMDAMDARGESFKILFLLGAQEGLFPRQVREDPLLRDRERAWLRHPCGYWIARKAAGYEEERLLFHLLAASARDKFYAVYSRSDEDGKPQNPSVYLRELCRAAGVSLEEAAVAVPRQTLPKLGACGPESLNPREAVLRLLDEGGDAAGYLDLLGRDGASLKTALSRLERLVSGGRAGPMDGITGPPKEYLRELLRKGLSPSALDDFGRCPFSFFASRVLGLDEREDESEPGDFSAALRGRIYHAILETFYKGKGRIAPATAADEVFALFGWRETGLYPVAWKAVKAVMEERLEAFVRWDRGRIAATGLVPSWFEKELRGRIAIPGLPRELEGLEFHGIADRVDLDEKGRRFQVVDYKTRWPRSKGSLTRKVLGGRMHQPPVYAELAQGELKGWKLEGASVYAVEDGEEEAQRLQEYPGGRWAGDREAVLSRIASYADRIARGRFPIRPDDGEMGYCRWCSFASICRKSHRRSRERAEAELAGSSSREAA